MARAGPCYERKPTRQSSKYSRSYLHSAAHYISRQRCYTQCYSDGGCRARVVLCTIGHIKGECFVVAVYFHQLLGFVTLYESLFVRSTLFAHDSQG